MAVAQALCGCGLVLMKQHDTLYLGVLLAFICPILAFQWFTFAHFFMWRPLDYVAAIVVQSAYVIVVDQYAISRYRS